MTTNPVESTQAAAPTLPPPLQMITLLTGFEVSQALYVVAKLDIASALRQEGPRTITELAEAAQADPATLGRIIRVLGPMGVFTVEGRGDDEDRIGLTALGETLAAGHPGSVRDMALFLMETHYAPFGELLHGVRTGQTPADHVYGQPFFDWIAAKPELVEVMNNAMATVTHGLRDGMFDNYRLPEGKLVADLGGGDGAMIGKFLESDPGRRGIVFDLPQVVPAAEQLLAAQGLTDRVEVVSGDFFEAVPAADVYVLSFVLHDWNDKAAARILARVAEAAAPGVRLVLVEAVVPPGNEPHPAKVSDLNMLGITGGRERSAVQFEKLLEEAGFTIDRIVPTPTVFSFVEATRRG